MKYLKKNILAFLLLCGIFFTENTTRLNKFYLLTTKKKKFKITVLLLTVYLVFIFDTVICMCFSSYYLENSINVLVLNKNDEHKVKNDLFRQSNQDLLDQSIDDDSDDKKNIVQKTIMCCFSILISNIYKEIDGYQKIDSTCENNSKYKRVCLLNYIHDSDGKKGKITF